MEKRTAIVSGGGKGIGRSISEQLAGDGWDLLICGRDEAALSQASREISVKFNVAVDWICVDLSKKDGPAQVFSKWEGKADELPQALVCNAADYGALGYFSETEYSSWKESFELNFFSVAELVHHFIRLIPEGGSTGSRKKIVIMSGGGLGGSKTWPGASAYCVAKAALYRFTEILHEEVGGLPLDINCVAPGAVKSGMTRQALEAGERALGSLFQSQLKVQNDGGDSPLLAARMISFLLSSQGDGISGRLISAKWDLDIAKENSRMRSLIEKDSDLYRLRRIDNELFRSGTATTV